jgi:HAD superfamily hydrolase (TIGR01509 family)
MQQNIEAVIFDLDGTLIDSMWVWEKIDEVYLARFGLKVPHDLEEVLEGKSFTETAIYFKERFELSETVEQIKESWNQIALDFYTKEVPLKKGAKDFLDYLQSHNIKMGIATSNSIELVTAVLESLKIREYFGSVRTSCEVEKGKPFPYIYVKVANDLSVEPLQCIAFEDIPNGILAAKRAGMKVWGVEDRQSKSTKEKAIEMADVWIKDYIEGLEKIKNQ